MNVLDVPELSDEAMHAYLATTSDTSEVVYTTISQPDVSAARG